MIYLTSEFETSFNGAALDTAVKALQAQNCNVVVSDLYAMKFKAFYGEESMLTWQECWLSADVEKQQKVKEVELIIFQDKKAMMSFTTGSHESMCHADGINGDINITLWSLQNGILHYSGLQVLSMLKEWQKHLEGLLEEKPLIFVPFANFDVGAGFKLKKEVQGSPVVGVAGNWSLTWQHRAQGWMGKGHTQDGTPIRHKAPQAGLEPQTCQRAEPGQTRCTAMPL
uniref:Flavodoxin-like fold domain-containing protein n=1 Tax=Scleropages formosus TaxID=113540 RepID=A0A8C9V7N9_SCLFO